MGQYGHGLKWCRDENKRDFMNRGVNWTCENVGGEVGGA